MGSVTFDLVSEIGFRLANNAENPYDVLKSTHATSLGPLIELASLLSSKGVPLAHLESLFGRTRTLDAILLGASTGVHHWRDDHHAVGVLACEGVPIADPRLRASGVHETSAAYSNRWSRFATLLEAGAQLCGLSRSVALGLAGVVQELQDNVFEHSCMPGSGLIGFRRDRGTIEAVVADRGVGILGGFQKAGVAKYQTHSDALRGVVYDRDSRFADLGGHGNGLRSIFAQLATLHGDLRFRTGDVSLSIEGNNFTVETIEETDEAEMPGFLISILVRPRAAALFAE